MMMRVSVTSLFFILGIFCSSTWARVHRRTADCGPGQFSCGSGATRDCIPQRWVCDGDNDCGNNSDEDQETCASRDCPSGQVKCQGESPRRWCIRESWICDGDNDCGNGWDEQNCEARDCPNGQVKCRGESPRRRCIRQQWVCDGDNDCGNFWDEDQCAGMTCRPGYISCPGGSGRCINNNFLCDGDNDCGDNSDEDPEACEGNVEVAARNCGNALHVCRLPLILAYAGMSPEEIAEQIKTADLSETCEPVLLAQECVMEILSTAACQAALTGHQYATEIQKYIAVANTTVNFICRDNVEVINENKECLLRPGVRDVPAVLIAIGQQCPVPGNFTTCPPQEAVDCVVNVVTEQCGEEIGGVTRNLISQIQEHIDCTKRSKMMKKEMYSPLEIIHKAFPMLF